MHRGLRQGTVGILRPRKERRAPQDDRARLRRPKRARNERQLEDLISVGPAIARDFELLGVHSVEQLAKRNPQQLYRKLERLTGQRQDPCVLDTFCAAVAQARNPRLEAAQCQWWWWSRKRKQRGKELGS